MIGGTTGSGKTTWLRRLLETPKIFSLAPERIIYCYGTWQKAFNEMTGIEFRKGLDIPKDFNGEHTVIILDDLMSEVVKSKTAEELFTQGSHHKNLTVIFILQNLFQQGKMARTIMLNSHYLVLMKNPRDVCQIKLLGRQLGMEKTLEEAYKDCMTMPYGYLFINLSPHNTEDFKLKTNIFPGENQIVYLEK